MSDHGDFALGVTFDIKFSTNYAGTPTSLLGSPVISAYPDNSTTEITAGITLSVDFDSRTGLNNVRVVATSGNGYAAGVNYTLVITTGTINGVSAIGYVVGSFSIEARSAIRPATAGRTLAVDTAGAVPTTYQVKKNTALAKFMFVMFDSTNHAPATGLTVSGAVSKDGAAFGALTNGVSELANGVYFVDLAAADLNGNVIALKFTATGADAQFIIMVTQI